MKKLSLVVSTIMLSSTMFAASAFDKEVDAPLKKDNIENANSIDEAFKNGKIEGSIALFGLTQDNKGQSKDFAFGNGNLTLGYNTVSFYGFSLGTQVKGNIKLGEKHKDDRKNEGPFENNALITQAYLQYSLNEMLLIKAGRYEGQLEWLTDYQQGAIAEITAIPDTTVSLAFSNRKAESGIDTSEDFHKPHDKGIYVVDIKNESFEGLEINPYYYQIPDVVKFYGLKTSYNLEHFGAIAQYAKSSLTNEYKTNNSSENDGYVAHFELNGNFEDLTSAVGLIKTSKKGGADIITSYGDSISPFEDGEKVYTLDARTIYGSLGYSIYDFEFGALYGITRYDASSSGLKEKELNLSVGYNFTKNLNTNIMYVNVDADEANSETDYNKYLASVEYKF
ncbi:Opr family porin [Aliarcobacter cryaerophilus]|uniref:Opr family porin n=1 Tax=Aliarcobacter cryaerophilus TaxID=28198 RepID=UPI0021B4764E|nr:Opr family porin [Aliarcobacter cryaerophilus]MCT7494090.1 Opr family porin [Aliarcobacter cryaerophilus]